MERGFNMDNKIKKGFETQTKKINDMIERLQ